MTLKESREKYLSQFKASYAAKKIERDKFVNALDRKSFDFQIATWFGSGLLIPAPGTWGTLGGLIFGLILWHLTNGFFVFVIALLLFMLGLRVVQKLESNLSSHDSSFIVIDEVVAILLIISFNAIILSWMVIPKDSWIPLLFNIFTFALFRYFDSRKPGFIGTVDRRVTDEWGVMMDDIVAAVYTMVAAIIMFMMFSVVSFGIF